MTTETVENNSDPRKKHAFPSTRRYTDRYWTGVFLVIYIGWIVSWQYLTHHEKDYKINLNNSQAIKILPQVSQNVPYSKIDSVNDTTANTTTPFVSNYWGQNWMFDAITFNVGFLDANYQKNSAIVVWTNILFSICLIVYSFASMRSDHVFCSQISYFGRPLIGFLLYYRFLMCLPNRSEMMAMIPFDKKLVFWVIPEIIFIIIWATKKSPIDSDIDEKSDNDNEDEEANNETREIDDDDENGKIVFRKFMGYVGLIGVTLFASLEILMLVTSNHVYQLSWDSPLFYAIAGGSLYFGLTLFYFGLMVIACATSISFDSQETTLKDVISALGIVGRYHFGTACYHATLIFPRLHATVVMNEAEFRKTHGFPMTNRFEVTHCKAHNLSPILTAVRGQNHSGSTRELLRLFISGSPKAKHFQGFAAMTKSFLALFIGANSLMITLLWTHGAVIDPRFMMGSWVMYLEVMLLNYIFMRAHDAVADTIWFHVDSEKVVKF